jgi:hypothetical protein
MLDWEKYTEIANRFQFRARPEDRQDLKHDIIVRLAKVAGENGHQLTEPAMLRIASYVVMEYWHNLKRSQTQVCLYHGSSKPVEPNYSKCSFKHKPSRCSDCCYTGIRQIQSLNYELDDGDGNTIELWQTIADDTSIDIEAWLDARVWLLGCPRRLVLIGVKLYSGKRLDYKDYHYIERWRQKELKKYQLALA